MDPRATTCIGCRPTGDAFIAAGRDLDRKIQPYSLNEAVTRLLSKAEPWGTCLLAQGYALRGYVRIKADGRHVLAHRAVVMSQVEIPDDMTVDHLCHNADLTCVGGPACLHRRCVNPEHLAIRTAVENWQAAKMWERRRGAVRA
jgi:hypothetical protein